MCLDHWILSLDLDLDLLRHADNLIDSMPIKLTRILCSYLILITFITYQIILKRCETSFILHLAAGLQLFLENLGWPIYGHIYIPLYRNKIKLNILHYNIKFVQCFSFHYNRKKLQVLLVFFYNFVQQRSATGFEQHLVLICKSTATD